MATAAPATIASLRAKFFTYLFGQNEGYVCIAHQVPERGKDSFSQNFFKWPNDRDNMLSFVQSITPRHNIWFCPQLLAKSERKKEHCLPTDLVWADLDECEPDSVEPKPPCVIETSPGRFQALWRLDKTVEPEIAENYSKRIAYANANNGADPSGWDLTQLLRVPATYNYKYENTTTGIPEVKLLRGIEVRVPVELFEIVPQPPLSPAEEILEKELPNLEELPSAKEIIYKYWGSLDQGSFSGIYELEPDNSDDWSKLLWRLINVCFEGGMKPEEVFAIALTSKVNKYERDGRPLRYLWRDVLKAHASHSGVIEIASTFVPLEFPTIVPSEHTYPQTFIEDYKTWAVASTDAVPSFHELSAFMLLSVVLAGHIVLKTSYGDVIPNLWGLVLGDSTLTRKTTAMKMAIELLMEIDPDYILATDGSAEGLLSGLSTRPNRTSVYFKDEVTGFFDSMNRKDYLSGMPETLTQLYDVPPIYTRRLRKETITVQKPIFIFYGGGIRDRVYQLLNDQYILSGFLPRFLVVSGEADIENIRRTGPATATTSSSREKLRNTLVDMIEHYKIEVPMKVGSQTVYMAKSVEAFLTTEAWKVYGDIEHIMAKTASLSPYSMLALPTYERQSRSLLKMSILLGASRQIPDAGTITITDADVLGAARYIQAWSPYVIDLIKNSGKSTNERVYERILDVVRKNPGILRGTVMQHQHLNKRDMDDVTGTLIDRGQIFTKKERNGTKLYPAG